MKAVWYEQNGDADILLYGDLADPEPDDYFELGCHEFGNDDDEALEKKSTN